MRAPARPYRGGRAALKARFRPSAGPLIRLEYLALCFDSTYFRPSFVGDDGTIRGHGAVGAVGGDGGVGDDGVPRTFQVDVLVALR